MRMYMNAWTAMVCPQQSVGWNMGIFPKACYQHEYAQHINQATLQVALNTIFSITGSTVMTFLLSGVVGRGKYNMMQIQNATLAGGVAMGAPSSMLYNPAYPFLIGAYVYCTSVFVCVCLRNMIQPCLGGIVFTMRA